MAPDRARPAKSRVDDSQARTGQTFYYGCILDFTNDANNVPISTEIGSITT